MATRDEVLAQSDRDDVEELEDVYAALGIPFTCSPIDEINALKAEIERLRRVIKSHWNFAAFVELWTNRNGVTDAVRVSAIKHHPSLRQWMRDGVDELPTATSDARPPAATD